VSRSATACDARNVYCVIGCAGKARAAFEAAVASDRLGPTPRHTATRYRYGP